MAIQETGHQVPSPDLLPTVETPRNMTLALIAPGQGSQRVGMGVELANRSEAAARLWTMAGDILGGEFIDICRKGRQEELTRTKNAQPAIVLDSLARRAALEELGLYDHAGWNTGNSLGFYTGLIASGALTKEDGFRLVRTRGEIAQESGSNDSSLVALKNVDLNIRQSLVDDFGLYLCLDNTDAQQVYGGYEQDLKKAIDWMLNKQNLIIDDNVRPLAVNGAFHSPCMANAVPDLARALDGLKISRPTNGKLVSISEVRVLETPEEIKEELLRQIVRTVRWREVTRFLAQQGVAVMVELSETPTLTKFNKDNLGGERTRVYVPAQRPDDETNQPVIAYIWKKAA